MSELEEFKMPCYTLHCQYVGNNVGGFDTRFAPEHLVKQNIAKLAKSFGAPCHVLMRLGQSDKVALVGDGPIIQADALITDKLDCNIIMTTVADCAPVVIFSKKEPLFAVVHGGRRNLDQGILEKTIRRLIQNFQVDISDLAAYIGPGIKARSYALPASVPSNLKHAGWMGNFLKKEDYILLDMSGFILQELVRLGISYRAIKVSQVDTAAKDGKYYSHYRTTRFGDAGGRNGFAVGMRSPL